MALKSIYKRSRNPMGNMGPLPAGNPSMSHRGSSRFPRPRWRPLAPHPQPHTPYKAPIPGRKLKRRGAAVIDANPYRTSLKALQRGTNVPIRLIGGEVRGHGASKRSRQEKREQERARMEQIALDNAAGGGGGAGGGAGAGEGKGKKAGGGAGGGSGSGGKKKAFGWYNPDDFKPFDEDDSDLDWIKDQAEMARPGGSRGTDFREKEVGAQWDYKLGVGELKPQQNSYMKRIARNNARDKTSPWGQYHAKKRKHIEEMKKTHPYLFPRK